MFFVVRNKLGFPFVKLRVVFFDCLFAGTGDGDKHEPSIPCVAAFAAKILFFERFDHVACCSC